MPVNTPTRTLGIDYGDARIGLALSYGTLAEPLIVIPNDGSHWDTLQSTIHEFNVSHLVIGQSEHKMAEKSIAFAQQLSSLVHLPVNMQDETLSSKEVQTKLREQRVGKKQYRGPIDHFAAAIILQRYLDEEA